MSTPPEQMPPSSSEPSAPPSQPPESDPAVVDHSTDDRNFAMLTHLSGLLLSFIVPLVVWLMHKDQPEKSYLVAEAKEALNFQITVLIGYVVCWVLTIIVIGAFLLPILWVINLVFCLIAAIQVSSSGTYRYPFGLRLVN